MYKLLNQNYVTWGLISMIATNFLVVYIVIRNHLIQQQKTTEHQTTLNKQIIVYLKQKKIQLTE